MFRTIGDGVPEIDTLDRQLVVGLRTQFSKLLEVWGGLGIRMSQVDT